MPAHLSTILRFTIIAFLLYSIPDIAIAGRLSQVRDEVRASPAPSKPKKKDDDHDDHGHHHHDGNCDDDDDLNNALGDFVCEALAWGLTSPFWGPPTAIGDEYCQTTGFLDYPYQHGCPTGIVFDPNESETMRWWRGRVQGEYIDNFDDLQSFGGQVLLESDMRFGFDSSMNYRRERLGGGLHDQLWTGDANLVFRFAQSEHLEMRTGAGFNWLSDDVSSEFGFNFTYSGDWFPCDPWVVSAEMDWGRLGSSELIHLRSTVGVQFHRFELYSGYDYYNVGGVELNGFIAGVRLWW